MSKIEDNSNEKLEVPISDFYETVTLAHIIRKTGVQHFRSS